MPAIARILCPVDYSDCSRCALEHAAAVARRYDSSLTVLHVGAAPGSVTGSPPEPPPAATGPSSELRGFVEPVTGVSIALEERQGPVVAEILDRARSLPADVIVMGTHGRSGVDRLMLGSVTEKVLRKASCPVLTVPPSVRAGKGRFSRVLCAVDFSQPSMTALQYAVSLARRSEASLLMLHVIEGMPDTEHWHHPDITLVRYLRDAEGDALQRLRTAVPPEARSWGRVDEVLSTGKPYREILRIAEERGVDLIVLGVHGRNPLDVMFFGSTAQQVVRTATCPVLTVRD